MSHLHASQYAEMESWSKESHVMISTLDAIRLVMAIKEVGTALEGISTLKPDV